MKSKKTQQNKKKTGPLIALIVIAAIIIGGVFYYYNQQKNSEENAQWKNISGPFAINKFQYKLGENIFVIVSDLKPIDAGKIVIVDPKGDTRTAAMTFSEQHKMTDYWHFLIGTQNQLSPVWTAYAIDAQRISASTSTHTSALYVIDKTGHERVLLDQDFTTTQMTSDLKTLLGK